MMALFSRLHNYNKRTSVPVGIFLLGQKDGNVLFKHFLRLYGVGHTSFNHLYVRLFVYLYIYVFVCLTTHTTHFYYCFYRRWNLIHFML